MYNKTFSKNCKSSVKFQTYFPLESNLKLYNTKTEKNNKNTKEK